MCAIRRTPSALFCLWLFLLTSNNVSGQSSIPATADASDAANESIELTLREIGSIDFVEHTLKDVAATLQQRFAVPILLSAKKLDEASVSPDTPVTKTLSNLPLESLLWHVLRDLELTFVVRDGVILITTPEDAESYQIIRVYPVLDLIVDRSRQPAMYGGDYDSLIELITSTAKPDSWDDVGGPGAIDCLDNAAALVVAQTRDVHRQIESLLTALRHAKRQQGIASVALPPVSLNASSREPQTYSTRQVSSRSASSWQIPQAHPSGK